MCGSPAFPEHACVSTARPGQAASAVAARCNPSALISHYNLPLVDVRGDPGAFLAAVARARGKLKRGGIPDMVAAARLLLQDWNSGVIKYFTPPPAIAQREEGLPEIVQTLGETFDSRDTEVLAAAATDATFAVKSDERMSDSREED